MRRRTLMTSALGLFIAPRHLFGLSGNKLFPLEEARADSSPQPRLITFYFPNGCDPSFWNIGSALSPLSELSSDAARKHLIFSNVTNPVSAAGQRDAHEQGGATLFTGSRLRDSDSGTGPSLDQIVSPTWNATTAMGKPLVCGVWRAFAGGEFRSTSWARRSWLPNGTPETPLQNPLDTFRSMFGLTGQSTEDHWRRSALDAVIKRYDEFSSATSKLSSSQRSQLADHMDKLRTIEKAAARFDSEVVQQCRSRLSEPVNVQPDASGLLSYESFEQAFRLHMDLIAEALACGLTRSASLMFGSAGEEYINKSISSDKADHTTSHYTNDAEKEIFLAYRRFHIRNAVYLANKLESLGILNSTALLVGSEFGESRTHTRNPQPHLLLGATDFFRTGTCDWGGRSQNDLYRTLLAGMGISMPQVGEAEFNDPAATPLITKT